VKQSFLSLFLVLTLLSCDNKNPEPGLEQTIDCNHQMIAREKAVSEYRTDGTINEVDISYDPIFDAHHRLEQLKFTFHAEGYPGRGVAFFYHYHFDDEGYLVSRTSELENQQSLIDVFILIDKFYTYQNGMLTQIDSRGIEYTPNGSKPLTNVVTRYRYDGNKRLIEQTEIGDQPGDNERKYTYQYDAQGRLKGYHVDDGTRDQYTIVDEKIAVMTIPFNSEMTFESHFTYDDKGQRKSERVYHNKAWQNTTEYFYDDQKRPISFVNFYSDGGPLDQLKGHPVIPNVHGERHNNILTVSYFNGYQRYISSESTITYASNGRPAKIVSRGLEADGTERSKTTTNYQYCR
jgi:YD repeat-containing protein